MGARSIALVACLVVGFGLAESAESAPRPVDDGDEVRWSLDHAVVAGKKIGLFQIESAQKTACWIYLGRVVVPMLGLREGDRVAFVDDIRDLEREERRWFERSPELRTGRAYPMMDANREYLVWVAWGDRDLDEHVRALGWTYPIFHLVQCRTYRVDLRDIRSIVPALKEYVAAATRPADERPAALRRWVLPRLNSRHAYLHQLVRNEVVDNRALYPGMSRAEATRLAEYSDTQPRHRFDILRNLALLTPHPMDSWYFRAVSRGAPGRIDPFDTATVMVFHDSLMDVAPRLSIDTFWPMLQQRTRQMSLWVEAFAQKRDPRLLPMIVRHLEPGHCDPEALKALKHYSGQPEAARALIDLVRRTNDLGENRQAQKLVYQALVEVGTPDARQAADRLRQAKNLE